MNKEKTQKILDLTQKGYIEISDNFSQTRQYSWPVFNNFIKYVKENDNILDIGCGNGRLAGFLDKHLLINYLGVDSNHKFIKIANESFSDKENIKFKVIDNNHININEKINFQVVFCIAMFNHIPDQEMRLALLKTIYNVLEKNSYLIMTNWNLFNIKKRKNIYNFLKDKLFLNKKKFFEKYAIEKKYLGIKDVITNWQSLNNKGHLYYYAYTLTELKTLMKKAGFKVVDAYYETKGSRVNILNGDNSVIIAQKNN